MRVTIGGLLWCFFVVLPRIAIAGFEQNLEIHSEKDVSALSDDEIESLQKFIENASEGAILKYLFPDTYAENILKIASMKEPLTAWHYDRIALLTGGMSAQEYLDKYRPAAATSVAMAVAEAIFVKWQTIPVEGAYCSNGSPYKVFFQPAQGWYARLGGHDKRLTVYMEPGGACWDYDSCSGKAGVRGAANPNGIPDNYMSFADFLNPKVSGGSVMPLISPVIARFHPSGYRSTSAKWNKVFVPYCTGDVFMGANDAVYTDPLDPTKKLRYWHRGADNTFKVSAMLAQTLPKPKQLLVTGCSAGGAGSLGHYSTFRKDLEPEVSMLLNDSGPIFPASAKGQGHQWDLHQTIRKVWNIDPVIDRIAADFPGGSEPIKANLGTLNTALARMYPRDTIALTLFKGDLNYSGYSYARFFGIDETTEEGKEQIHQLWSDDVQNQMDQYDQYPNLKYFIPFMRDLNESHCSMVISYTGSEVNENGYHVGAFAETIFAGKNPSSMEEAPNETDPKVTDPILELLKAILSRSKS